MRSSGREKTAPLSAGVSRIDCILTAVNAKRKQHWEPRMNDLVRGVVFFLLFGAVWIVAWKALFIVVDIALGKAPFVIAVGAIVTLLLTGKLLQHRNANRK